MNMNAFGVVTWVIAVLLVIKLVPEIVGFLKSEFEAHGMPFYPVAALFLIFLYLACFLLNDFGYRSEFETPRIEVSQEFQERMGG